MAGDWMKIELELPDKPEVHSISSMLNIDPDAVVGKLIRVWQWFDKHTTDGNAHGVTFSLPDRITGVTGFGEAMQFVGWLEQQDKHLVMPKFDRHTSASAKQRALTAKRVDKKRNANSNASSVTQALPREEKRREDIDNIDTNVSIVGKENPDHKTPTCPHQEIIALYAEIIPSGIQPRVWEGARASALKTRWRENAKRQNMDYWRKLFSYIAESPFLMGKVNDANRRPFEISLDWIVKAENFAKIIEGKYHGKAAA